MEQFFCIEGHRYTLRELKSAAQHKADCGIAYVDLFWAFIRDWFSDEESVQMKTSGSTGTPKQIVVRKEFMRNSAQMTLAALGLRPGSNVLQCLSSGYVAGKMMIVRALEGSLNLTVVEPKSSFTIDADYDLCSMVPMQMHAFLKNGMEGDLNHIKNMLVGGSAVDESLWQQINAISTHCYATYGMTETVSHIALRKLNGADRQPRYYVLPNIALSLDSRGCLVIDAPLIAAERVATNDMARIFDDKSFEILGRVDNVINTGGVKVIPEHIEAKLSKAIDGRYAISSAADGLLGEKVVLVLEQGSRCVADVNELLTAYERPKEIVRIEKLPETTSGKLDRISLRKAIAAK